MQGSPVYAAGHFDSVRLKGQDRHCSCKNALFGRTCSRDGFAGLLKLITTSLIVRVGIALIFVLLM